MFPNRLLTISEKHEHPHPHDHEEEDDLPQKMTEPSIVFEACYTGQDIPEGFNAVKILLNGTITSDLKWDKERAAAEKYTRQGLRILWEMDFGLFNRLEKPIGNQSQFQSFSLSLEHFRNTLWKQFQAESIGLCLYRGSPKMISDLHWDEEQISNLHDWLKDRFTDPHTLASEIGHPISHFSLVTLSNLTATSEGQSVLELFFRDIAAEYLELLGDRLPDTLKCFILMDCTKINETLLRVQLTSRERYPRFIVGAKCHDQEGYQWNDLASQTIGLLSQSIPSEINTKSQNIGLCIPSVFQCLPSAWKEMDSVLSNLNHQSIPFRSIPEADLTTEWDGLDYLIVSSKNLTPQGLRKLLGFCAAGGTVVSIGNPIGLPQELNNRLDSIF